MAQLSDLRTTTRRRIGENSTVFFTDAELTDLLNEAQDDLSSEGGIVEADRGFAIVANQYEYTPPADFINVRYALWKEEDKLAYITPRQLFVEEGAGPDDTDSEPDFYTVWEREIRLYPTPTTASSSTTLTGAHSNAVTTLTVGDASDFLSRGRAILDDAEEVQYYDKSATQLLQVVRARAGTTAATYSGGESVKQADFRLFYYKTPTAMSADADTPDIPVRYHNALTYYAAAMCMMKDQQYDKHAALMALFERKKYEARAEEKRRQRDRNITFRPGDRPIFSARGRTP